MDPRRLLSLAACGLLLSACSGVAPLPDVPRIAVATLPTPEVRILPSSPTERAYLEVVAGADVAVDVVAEGDAVEDQAVIANAVATRAATPADQPPEPAPRPQPVVGPTAIAAANAEARAASSSAVLREPASGSVRLAFSPFDGWLRCSCFRPERLPA